MTNLGGIHDREGCHILPPGGWCVDTIALSENPAPTDYATLRGDINWIVRLNWGYGSTGTIPLPIRHDDFAQRCMNYVAKSKGARIWIIGNEPNHEQERPNGVFITPAMYAACFRKCRIAIKTADSSAQVVPAPCAPYHADPMDWTAYWQQVLEIIARDGGCDGIAVHAYTRSSDPKDIASDAMMGPPLDGLFSGFLTYQDALDLVPDSLAHLPAYITEFNELLPDGWDDRNTGVVQVAYANVNDWNQSSVITTKVHCLCLYRWPKYDKWHIEGKRGVIDDFQAAIGRGYTSPVNGNTNVQTPTTPNQSPTPAPDLPPREWDERLTQRGIELTEYQPQPGETYMRLVEGEYWEEKEHTFVETLGKDGKRLPGVTLRWWWGNGNHDQEERKVTELKPNDRWMVDFPMFNAGRSYGLEVLGYPSDKVFGMGLGSVEKPDWNIHVSYKFVFQLVTASQATTPPVDVHLPQVGKGPQPAQPIAYVVVPAGANIRSAPNAETARILTAVPYREQVRILGVEQDNWLRVRYGDVQGYMHAQLIGLEAPDADPVPVVPEPSAPRTEQEAWARSRAFIKKWEGGYQNVHNDKGNWTGCEVGKGELKGTKYGISACSYPHLDIKNLTEAQADEIYRTDYWQRSGADKLPWPMCLLVLDTSVLHGVGTAQRWVREFGPNPYLFAARRLESYTKQDNFDFWGKAWTLRVADLLEEMAK